MVLVPRPLDPLLNILYPFSAGVWMSLLGTVVAVAFFAGVFYRVYGKVMEDPGHHRSLDSNLDFLLFTIGMLAQEPNFPWFEGTARWSGGSQLMVLWAMTGMVLTMAYTSNLLASLMAVKYEEPIDNFHVNA